MAQVTCAISGIRFKVSCLEHISIDHTAGYFHPIFALPHKQLHQLYAAHCKGKLSQVDSYLTFLSLINYTGKVDWQHPVTLDPAKPITRTLVENNISQLVRVIEQTDCIRHPSFTQPSFKVTYENSRMIQIANWIKAWEENLSDWKAGRASLREAQSLQAVENKLTHLIYGGSSPAHYSHVVADWADKAAEFPPHRAEEWKKVIRSCFNTTKMFNTPLSLIKEIKDYCECNIDVGSVHFHTLMEIFNEGIARNTDYLGGSSLALGYTLLPTTSAAGKQQQAAELKNAAEVAALAAKAPATEPVKSDYSTVVDYLRAKLAYRVAAATLSKQEQAPTLAPAKMSDTITAEDL